MACSNMKTIVLYSDCHVHYPDFTQNVFVSVYYVTTCLIHLNSYPINTAVSDGYFPRASLSERSLSQKRAYVSIHDRVRGFAG